MTFRSILAITVLVGSSMSGIFSCDAVAQAVPEIKVTVLKSPGGKGKVVSYDTESELLTVQLAAPGGRVKAISVSKHHVAGRAWKSIIKIINQVSDDERQQANSDNPSENDQSNSTKSAQLSSNGELKPIQVLVENIPGGTGSLISYNADTDTVVLDFNGQRGRPIPVNQLESNSWREAQKAIAVAIPVTSKSDAVAN